MSNLAKLFDPQSLSYLGRSAAGYLVPQKWRCPCCGARDFRIVSRKAIVTALVRCSDCRLLYRCPGDPEGLSDEFYEADYVSGGLTTSLPGTEMLETLLSTGFRKSQKDFTAKIAVLEALGVQLGARVLDFGASWGYATWQFKDAGYDVEGYEISQSRARFGEEKLGVRISSSLDELPGDFDVLFSSHVIEHFPNPREAFDIASQLLKPGGYFIAFTPNGSISRLASGKKAYNHSWGRLHPVYLDEEFYSASLPSVPKLFTSRQYGQWQDLDDVRTWDRKSLKTCDLSQPELLFVFRTSE